MSERLRSRAGALAWLYGLHHFGVKLGLDNVRGLLAAFGDPQYAYATVHVAGTNGKGSVAALLASILTAAGYRVGLYTSPHLVRYEERVRIDGREIPARALCALVDELRELCSRLVATGAVAEHPTFFEVTTALAFEHFRRRAVHVAVIETGLGGRLDATNTLRPELAVVTRVDRDHVRTLGGNLSRIAAEKAAIYKPGAGALTGESRRRVLAVLAARCTEIGVRLERVEEPPHADGAERFRWRSPRRDYRALHCALPGRHQWRNACLAIRAAELLEQRGFRVDADHVRRGLRSVRWPGRLEWFPGAPAVLLDGAHNAAGAAALAAYLRQVPHRPLALVFGAGRDKDLARMTRRLFPLVDAVWLTASAHERATPPARLYALGRLHAREVRVEADPVRALVSARRRVGAGGAVCICGSLYLVGDLRAHLVDGVRPA